MQCDIIAQDAVQEGFYIRYKLCRVQVKNMIWCDALEELDDWECHVLEDSDGATALSGKRFYKGIVLI